MPKKTAPTAKKTAPASLTGSSAAPSSGPDRYFLNVSAYNAVVPGQPFQYCVTDPLVPWSNNLGSSLQGDTIVISAKVDILIFITSSTGTDYFPVGVSLIGAKQNPDPQGKKNFKVEGWDSAIRLKAKFEDPGTWKLQIHIADYSGPSPTVGIIDPDIENDANANVPPP
jgi:hypothetical protein